MPLLLKLEKCTGCKVCQLACSAVHEGAFNPEKARIQIIHQYTDSGIQIESNNCILCNDCQTACPDGAISNNGQWMIVDPVKCNGCGTCVDECLADAIFLNAQQKAVICDLCEGAPECIKWCPKGALTYKEPAPKKARAANE